MSNSDYDRDIQRQRQRLDEFKATMGFMVSTFGMDADDRVFYKALARKALLDPYAVQLAVAPMVQSPTPPPAPPTRAPSPLVNRTTRIVARSPPVPPTVTPPSPLLRRTLIATGHIAAAADHAETVSDGQTEEESSSEDDEEGKHGNSAPLVLWQSPTTARGPALTIAAVCKAAKVDFSAGMRLAVGHEMAVLWREVHGGRIPDTYTEQDRPLLRRAVAIVRDRLDRKRGAGGETLRRHGGGEHHARFQEQRFEEQHKRFVKGEALDKRMKPKPN